MSVTSHNGSRGRKSFSFDLYGKGAGAATERFFINGNKLRNRSGPSAPPSH